MINPGECSERLNTLKRDKYILDLENWNSKNVSKEHCGSSDMCQIMTGIGWEIETRWQNRHITRQHNSVRRFVCRGNKLLGKAGCRVRSVWICFRRGPIMCLHIYRPILRKEVWMCKSRGWMNESHFVKGRKSAGRDFNLALTEGRK